MSQDQPETPRGQLAREAMKAYNELTAQAVELSPEAAQAVRSLRESLTSLVAPGTAADLQITEMERTMEEFESIFYGGDVTVSARLLRRHLSAEQRADLGMGDGCVRLSAGIEALDDLLADLAHALT
jgi:hypothetical protein